MNLSPRYFQNLLSLNKAYASSLALMRETCRSIVRGEDHRIPVILGPCSIHSMESALLYGQLLKRLQNEVRDSLYLIMRVYVEKARTAVDWKGFVYDPFLNGVGDLEKGVTLSRKLLLDLLSLEVPCAMEFVNPLMANYFQDLLSWGFIGARTASSQIHRELASSLAFPVGFKNSLDGNLGVALHGIISSNTPHSFLGVDNSGQISSLSSCGNPYSHLVLRGSTTSPNCDRKGVEKAAALQKGLGVNTKILIDCAHGNSCKNIERQKAVFHDVIEQLAEGNQNILGVMLESFIERGTQRLDPNKEPSPYISLTDPCLSFTETKELIHFMHRRLAPTAQSLPTLTASTYR